MRRCKQCFHEFHPKNKETYPPCLFHLIYLVLTIATSGLAFGVWVGHFFGWHWWMRRECPKCRSYNTEEV